MLFFFTHACLWIIAIVCAFFILLTSFYLKRLLQAAVCLCGRLLLWCVRVPLGMT